MSPARVLVEIALVEFELQLACVDVGLSAAARLGISSRLGEAPISCPARIGMPKSQGQALGSSRP
jgi:hypothetical protein